MIGWILFIDYWILIIESGIVTPMSVTKPSAKKDKLGYPMMEKLLETEDFNRINESMSRGYEQLEKMLSQKTGGLGKQKNLRKALKAYDLTIALLRELLKKKYEMIGQNLKTPPAAAAPAKKM